MKRLARHATWERVAEYGRLLPTIKDPERFAELMKRKRAMEAVLTFAQGDNGMTHEERVRRERLLRAAGKLRSGEVQDQIAAHAEIAKVLGEVADYAERARHLELIGGVKPLTA